MSRLRDLRGIWRDVALTFVVLALVMRVAIPPGMMAGPAASGFPIVVCTGHGPLVIGEVGGPKAPPHKTSDAPCAFAAAAAAATPPVPAVVSQPLTIVVERSAVQFAADLAPGRGLAAPPPPSHAPPTVSV